MRPYFGGFRTVEAQEARRWFRRGHRGDHHAGDRRSVRIGDRNNVHQSHGALACAFLIGLVPSRSRTSNAKHMLGENVCECGSDVAQENG